MLKQGGWSWEKRVCEFFLRVQVYVFHFQETKLELVFQEN